MTLLFKDFQDYIEDLCEKHKVVQHGVANRKSFFRMNGGEEALAAIPNNAASPYVMINSFSGRPYDDEGSKLQQVATLLFLCRSRAQISNRADETERAQEEAMEVMMDFIARMKEDYEADSGCGALQYLQQDLMEYEAIGPVNQLEYGWKLTISFRTNMPAYNAANWIA